MSEFLGVIKLPRFELDSAIWLEGQCSNCQAKILSRWLAFDTDPPCWWYEIKSIDGSIMVAEHELTEVASDGR